MIFIRRLYPEQFVRYEFLTLKIICIMTRDNICVIFLAQQGVS